MHRFLIIGFGKLGSSLGRFLVDSGYGDLWVVDPMPFQTSFESVVTANHYFRELSAEVIDRASFIFICTGDDQIVSVARLLASFDLKNKYVVHTSGATGIESLVPLRERGALVGSFHPLQTFNEPFLPAERWHSIFATFLGDAPVLHALRVLFQAVNTRVVAVSEGQKKALHLAATVTANFQTALFSWADEIIRQAGLEPLSAGELLAPLVRQVTENFSKKPLPSILSGPLQRGDLQTIERHVHYLRQTGDPISLELYRLLCLKLLQNREFPIENRDKLVHYFNSLET